MQKHIKRYFGQNRFCEAKYYKLWTEKAEGVEL